MSCNSTTIYQHRGIGVFFTSYGVICLIVYIVCILAFTKKPNTLLSKSQAYKFMFIMGFVDITNLSLGSVLSGIISLFGYTYCPDGSQYWIRYCGMVITASWVSYECLCISLSLERCLTLVAPQAANIMFGNNKAWLVCGISVAIGYTYAIVFDQFIGLVIYQPAWGQWMTMPNMDKIDDSKIFICYVALVNVTTPLIIITCYSISLHNLYAKWRLVQRGSTDRMMLKAFTTSAIVCTMTTGVCVGYVFIPQIANNPFVFFCLNVWWQTVHGSNCFIYICINDSIRQKVRELFCGPILTKNRTSVPDSLKNKSSLHLLQAAYGHKKKTVSQV